jgi:hypothetical protein
MDIDVDEPIKPTKQTTIEVTAINNIKVNKNQQQQKFKEADVNVSVNVNKKLFTREEKNNINSNKNVFFTKPKISVNKSEDESNNCLNLVVPDYSMFSDENLKQEIKKYGMKPCSKKQMVKLLKEIWEFLNMSNCLV